MKRLTDIALAVVVLMIVSGGSAFAQNEWGQGMVNVNTASRDELVWFLGQAKTGNAQELADNIITYRDANGPFTGINDLRNVGGIDSVALKSIRLLVKVSGNTMYDPEAVRPAPGNDEPYRPSRP